MQIDPQAARLLRMLGAAPRSEVGRIGIGERRRAFDGLMRQSGTPPAIGAVRDRTVAGPAGPLRLRTYAPAAAAEAALPGLLYFHGGGLVAGGLDSYDALCRRLTDLSGCRLVAVDYRLAPEHPFPAAIEDALCAAAIVLDAAEDFGLDPERIAVGGDSAGGTLTAVVTQTLRARPGRRLAAQILLCPVLDFCEERPSKRDFGRGFLLDTVLMDRDLEDLAPDRPLDDPWISPLRSADLSGLPPALIHTAGFDPLRDEGRDYADRLTASGVPVHYTCHESLVHHFYGLAGMIPAAQTSLEAIGRELSTILAPTPRIKA